jgi:enediyne biosynthesis protein E4
MNTTTAINRQCDKPCRGWAIWVVLAASQLFVVAGPEWINGPGYRSAPLAAAKGSHAGLSELSTQITGITFSNLLSSNSAARNQILLNGSGVAAGDVDGDGWCDLYFCRLEGANVLYRNLGNWRFEEVTGAAKVACEGQPSTGAVFADVDGDGDLDLLVNSVGGGTRLFLNDGHGQFTESIQSGLVRSFGSTSMALADIDGDGDLDLYVANYRTTTIRSTGFELLNVDGRRMVKPEDRDRLYITPEGFIREYGEVDCVYLNDGKGHFQQLSWTDGRFLDSDGKALTTPPRDWALSVMFRDLNGDGAPDIYVCNDFWSPDKMWINDGTGHFREAPRTAFPCSSTFSMCADFADLNRDGFDDFMVLDMLSPDHVRRVTQTVMFGLEPWPVGYAAVRPQVTRNTLFLNRGDQTYSEIAQLSGLHATDWSWCPVFLDVDLDGYEDLLIATGNTYDTQDQDAEEHIRALGPWPREKAPYKLWQYPPLRLPKMAFRNRGDLTFQDMSQSWGFNSVGVAQGMCLADLDNDGDLDVVINQLNGPASIYRNECPAPRITVRLRGLPPNTQGIGTKIRICDGAVSQQSQEIICGGRYLSCDQAARVFAPGNPTNNLRLEVSWRSGKQSVVVKAKANCVYEIQETAATNAPQPKPKEPPPLFVEVSALIAHTHHQELFDDFALQPLQPNKLSQLGPGVSWYDVDGDGWEDLIIAGGRGGAPAIFRNDGKGSFSAYSTPLFKEPLKRAQTTILGWRNPAGQAVLLSGASNYEDRSPEGASVRQFNLTAGAVNDGLPGGDGCVGPLALADIDGDGDLDLFVGSRVIPARYPVPASSRIFRNDQGEFQLDADASKAFDQIGLVSGAVFSDLDKDGEPELILACEWGPIRVFHLRQGQYQDLTKQFGLDRFIGWWTAVAVADLDGDGRMDIIGANWGRNTPYESHRRQPLKLYYGDFNQVDQVDLIEAYYDSGLGKTVPERSFASLGNAMPFFRERITTHRAFAEASVSEILGDRFKAAHELSANTLESMVFLNRGDHFDARALPIEAQFAPAFGVCAGDMDVDGKIDVFLCQNFFATHPLNSPYDAGRGLLLRGDGRGGFAAITGQESGIKVYGEQRGCALADYDHDGRLDLVVAQNAGATRLFHSQAARSGLRVRLRGPVENPDGVGAQVWLNAEGKTSAVQEIAAGSGYWSQNAAALVYAAPAAPSMVNVRWPWGKTTTNAMPNSASEIIVDFQGKLEKVR